MLKGLKKLISIFLKLFSYNHSLKAVRYMIYLEQNPKATEPLSATATVGQPYPQIRQCFHLQGNFLAKGNFGTCREKCKELKLTRK
jgi:hypothetical protein